MIPYGRQLIDDDDIQSVIEVLRSDFLTQGPAVPAFEKAIAEYCGASHGVAVNSATSALHIACLALGVGPGDIVWTSPITFLATANCARYCGASVDFVDIDSVKWGISIEALTEKLRLAAKNGTLPKVVIPVHFMGHPCDLQPIHELSQKYGFHVIEDASHAIGARYHETRVGDCRYSDITVFSFHPVKIITTAEGGLATTNSSELARRMQLFRSHGMTREMGELENTEEGMWYYEQHLLGFNYRMTELQAALGLSQIKHIEAWIARRHLLADCYDMALESLPLARPARNADSHSALHLYCIQVERRKQVFEAMRNAGIGVNVHYIPVHLQPYYRRLGFQKGQFPVSEAFYERALSLPMFPGLRDTEQAKVIKALEAALE